MCFSFSFALVQLLFRDAVGGRSNAIITKNCQRGILFFFFFSPASARWKLFVHSKCSDCHLKAGLSSESEQS